MFEEENKLKSGVSLNEELNPVFDDETNMK